MNRMLWPLGLLLLVGTLIGAGWALNHTTPQAGANGKEMVNPDAPPVVVCFGQVDVEKGVADLYPRQFGEVAEVAETVSKDGKDRLFKKGEVLLQLKSQL